ncbi:hypothetical protein MFUL124B02_42360 [Myxococcus fulvus 124B02]|nr:hypothetical protein MFUL124B02_42360 [Myxococcus fulvus 124B02]
MRSCADDVVACVVPGAACGGWVMTMPSCADGVAASVFSLA